MCLTLQLKEVFEKYPTHVMPTTMMYPDSTHFILSERFFFLHPNRCVYANNACLLLTNLIQWSIHSRDMIKSTWHYERKEIPFLESLIFSLMQRLYM